MHEQEFGEILSAVVKIQMHPDYNPFTFEADVAVVELAQTIDFDQYNGIFIISSGIFWDKQAKNMCLS